MKRMKTISVLTEEVKKLMQEWIESYAKRDTAFLERHLSDDYVSTFPDGTVLDKKGEIEAVKAGAVAFTETPREMKVRIYGEVAVITGRSTIEAKVKGQDVTGEYRFTHVWIKQSDGWQVVASQVTRIVKP
jgi:ketosteroid isomerase-like protein